MATAARDELISLAELNSIQQNIINRVRAEKCSENDRLRGRLVREKLKKRSCWLLAACAIAAALLNPAGPVRAQDYPPKSTRIIVPFAAGGDIDSLARILGNHLQANWGQTVIVENRAGAGGAIGAEFVAKAQPDGSTLLLCSSGPLIIAPTINPKISYVAEKDFTAVSIVGNGPFVFLANSTIPGSSLAEFLAAAKSRPGQFTFASAGIGTLSHLIAMAFSSEAGVSLVHVPYRGGAPAVQDLIGGHVNIAFNPTPSSLTALAGKQVRALAVTTATRSVFFPDIPTLDELGLKGFDISSWYGICAPKGLPATMAERLNKEFNAVVASATVKEQFRALGTDAVGSTMAEFSSIIADEMRRWSKVVKDNNIRAE